MNIKKTQWFILLLLSMISINTMALPSAFTAAYSVSKSGLTLGEMKTSLRYNGNAYQYNKTSKSSGLVSWLSGDKIVENAEGIFNNNYLQSRSYLYHHTSKRKDKKDQLKFISPETVKGEYKGEAYHLKVAKGSIDRATLELALARDLAQGKKDLSYTVVERGEQKVYHLRRQGVEMLKINGKKYVTEKLTVVRDNSNRKTTFWLAKALDYMPVKIDHIEKGDAIVTQLKWFKFLTKNKQ